MRRYERRSQGLFCTLQQPVRVLISIENAKDKYFTVLLFVDEFVVPHDDPAVLRIYFVLLILFDKIYTPASSEYVPFDVCRTLGRFLFVL